MDHQVHAARANIPGFYALQNRLAKAGTSFSYAHTVLPICSPARASMLTALYPHAHGLTENDGRFGGRDSLSPDEWMVHWPLLEADIGVHGSGSGMSTISADRTSTTSKAIRAPATAIPTNITATRTIAHVMAYPSR